MPASGPLIQTRTPSRDRVSAMVSTFMSVDEEAEWIAYHLALLGAEKVNQVIALNVVQITAT